MNYRRIKKVHGFSLLEMSIVLAIVALLLTGLIPSISSQIEQKRRADTSKYLDDVKDALYGFAISNGRLPCPASTTSNGKESFCTGNISVSPCVPTTTVQVHGHCSNPYDGLLPAVTLGLSPTDAQGYSTDAWGGAQNRVRYAVYEGQISGGTNNYSTFTASGEIKIATMASIATTTPLLSVCASASTSHTSCSGAGVITLTNQAPAIIYSAGLNAATGGTSTDESANPNPNTPANSLNIDPVFVSHESATASSTNGEFDDMVTWLSTGVLFNRMLTAGQLP
ncbi:MAG: type II secretion system protein [Gallionellaceae bacterium]